MNSDLNNQSVPLPKAETGELPPGGEDCDLNLLARFHRFEAVTRYGIYGMLTIAVVIFLVEPVNYRWWLIWPLALFSFRNLQRQRISLSKEKPFESRVANIGFLLLIILMIVRDILITIQVNP